MLFVTVSGIYNLEATPTKTALFHEKDVFCHTNHLLHPSLKETPESPTPSSLARHVRLQQLIEKRKTISPIALQHILADHKGQLPICRHTGQSQTLATIIMNIIFKCLILDFFIKNYK
jgi:hypothetical protein